ncbi:ribbon-helix-helix domain-containing protein [Brevundimonas sp.]|uniref:ribbon-helix-helix domain-containing protein n=2 Tax=Brevundimonas sp. TaxID=1871086 RepID=UPI003D127EE7
MATMNISLPDALKTFIDDQVSDQGFGTSSEYIRALVRQDQQKKRIRDMLLEGRNSGPGVLVDDAYWERQRERIRQFEHKKSA